MYKLLGIAALAGSLGVEAAAQQPSDGWRITVGGGGIYAPAYEGDDDYRLSLVPNIEARYGERFFASLQNGVGYRVLNHPSLSVGPIGRVKFSRDEDGDQPFAVGGEDTSDLIGLGDVDTSIELGGFVEYGLGAWTLSAEVRQAVSGHDGAVLDLGARWTVRSEVFEHDVLVSAGPSARLVSDRYNEAYFGVSPTQAAASGLPIYEASGGLHSYGIGANAILPISEDGSWSLVGLVNYVRLSGDAGASPLVRERGSRDQALVGFFIGRTF